MAIPASVAASYDKYERSRLSRQLYFSPGSSGTASRSAPTPRHPRPPEPSFAATEPKRPRPLENEVADRVEIRQVLDDSRHVAGRKREAAQHECRRGERRTTQPCWIWWQRCVRHRRL